MKSATDADGDAITYGVGTQPDWITGVAAQPQCNPYYRNEHCQGALIR